MGGLDLGFVAAESGIQVSVTEAAPKLIATIQGSAETPAIETMRELVNRLHAHACETKVQEVVVDLTDLEFMSSSCFKCLVMWLHNVTELSDDARYRICFRSTPVHLWQRRSLHVLQTMATHIISVDTVTR